jgi:hypothetical protein
LFVVKRTIYATILARAKLKVNSLQPMPRNYLSNTWKVTFKRRENGTKNTKPVNKYHAKLRDFRPPSFCLFVHLKQRTNSRSTDKMPLWTNPPSNKAFTEIGQDHDERKYNLASPGTSGRCPLPLATLHAAFEEYRGRLDSPSGIHAETIQTAINRKENLHVL